MLGFQEMTNCSENQAIDNPRKKHNLVRIMYIMLNTVCVYAKSGLFTAVYPLLCSISLNIMDLP